MRRLALSLFLTFLFTLIKSNAIPQDVPKEQASETVVIYGVIPEDVQSLQPVIVTPPILNVDSSHEVCEYKLEPKISNSSVPFRIVLRDKRSGSALVVVSEGSRLDYEEINHYELNLITVFCDTSIPVSSRNMSIRVADVNEFAPEFKEQGYLIEVAEGVLYDPILKIEATDKDGSEQYSAICRYKLVTEGVPFVLDDKGYLKNTEHLNYQQRHNFILEVVAEDCGGLVSNKAFVNILITEKCRAGWKGLKSQMNYDLPSHGPSLLLDAKGASLQLCDQSDNCTLEQVTVSLRLFKTNSSISGNILESDIVSIDSDKTCELDSESVERRLETCESELGMIDLIHPDVIGRNISTGGANGLSFNGSTAYGISTYKLKDDVYKDYLVQERAEDIDDEENDKKRVESFVMTRDGENSKFSISMWMKRDYEDAFSREGRDEKQSILCNSDGEGMSRSHVNLFLHNCHLVMLARFEPSGRHIPNVLKKSSKDSSKSSGDEDDDEVTMDDPIRNEDDEFYRPSEWHWKLDQTCDDKWHHYAVNVDQNKARLFVDGNLFISTPRNPVVLEDHALHLSKKVHSTRLTVGACWKGLSQNYGDHFRGHLAELRVLRRKLLRETTIKCISNCNEKLDFHSINEMESGMSISMNSQMTELTINGRTKASVEHLLSTVGYTNPRMTSTSAGGPTSSISSVITFQTSIKCIDETYPRPISKESMKINLLPSDETKHDPQKTPDVKNDVVQTSGSSLFISGTQRLDYSEKDISRGIPVFRDAVIYRYPPEKDLSYQELIKDNTHMKEIESCTVRVSPPMDEEVEDMTHPHALAYKNKLRVDTSPEGLIIKGPSRTRDYIEVLKKTYYINKRPEDFNKKIFVLFCHDGAGNKSKDDLVVELNAIHLEYQNNPSLEADHMGQDKVMHPVNGPQRGGDGIQVETFSDGGNREDDNNKTGNASVVATITVCICVLMVVISVGMYRVFFHRQKTVKVHVDNQQEPQWDRSTITITVNPLETAALKEEEPSEREDNEETPVVRAVDGYYDDDDDIGSAHEMMRDTEEEEDEDDDGEKKAKKRKNKYNDEDASKINHFVLSDTE